ncbi:hypothetical protein PHISCL_04740 [Aspergillus sclerotialis]|uniref:CorA-like transporter domain-containing protein n=1 Tax=Aspergillus sclerotialis TaxID=2070753 RepID=A0A3A3A0T7_9EURO|nr:hypothetical protein PHISCL_04740 [Aspergillus sclerotialis]
MNLTKASPEFLDIVSCFYKRSTALEEAFCNGPFFKCNAEGMEIAYIFKYAFYKGDIDGKDPWSIRQTGVYQKYNFATKSSTWIFLHPAKQSAFQTRLEEMLTSSEECSRIRDHLFFLHNIFISTSFPHWRDFMAYYEARLLTQHKIIMGSSLNEPLRINHQTLNTVIFIENRFLTLRTVLHSVRKAFETIHKANDALCDADIFPLSEREGTRQLFDNYINQADEYTQNVSFLHTRAGRTAQLIADTLSFKNALTAQEQSRYMLSLTSSTVEDSTTVRTITIVTLIFLPSTFMATVLGMNGFFEMDPQNHNLVVSPQFWIFVVCAIPLTLLTVFCWWMRRKKQERPQDEKAISMV